MYQNEDYLKLSEYTSGNTVFNYLEADEQSGIPELTDANDLDTDFKANMVEREYYEEGTIKSETFYNNEGKISHENFYYTSGVLKQSNTYNDGLISKEIIYADNKAASLILTQRIFTYNSSNQLSQIVNYNLNSIDTTEKYTYNHNGTIDKINIYFGSSTNLKNEIRFSYDESNKILTETKYSNDKSTITDKISYTYNSDGSVSRKLVQFGFNKPNPTTSGMKYKWTLIAGEDIRYTYTDGRLTKEETISAYMEPVTKKVGTMTYEYSDYLHTRTTKDISYNYDNEGNITRKVTKVGYEKPNPKASGMEHVWTLRTEDDISYTYTNGKITKETTISSYMESVTKKVGTMTYTYSDWINTRKTKEVLYTYDDIGNIKSKETILGYDKPNPKTSGMEYEWSYRTSDKTIYSYNSNNRISEITKYGSYADMVSKKVGTVTYTYYEYNTRKCEEIRYTYNDDSNITSEKLYRYKYDDDKNWISYLAQNKTYEYNSDGYLEYFKMYNEGYLAGALKFDYIYDENNRLIKQIVYKGTIVNNSVYSYTKYQEIDINPYYNNLNESLPENILNQSDGNYITNNDINLIIQNMAAYAENNTVEFTGIESVKNNADLMNLVSTAWHN